MLHCWHMVSSRRSFVRLVAGAFASAAAACVSPTLPLPPPETPVVLPGVEEGRYVLQGGPGAALPDAIVVAINGNPSLDRTKRVTGTQAQTDGSWRMEIYASPGDTIDVTQERSDERSAPVTVRIPR